MDRRALAAGGATVVALISFVLAASTAPERLWVTPAATRSIEAGQQLDPASNVVAEASDDSVASSGAPWGGPWWQLLGAVLIAGTVLAPIVSWRGRWGSVRSIRRPGARSRATALPEVPIDEPDLDVDLGDARLALDGGVARNAIVQCWLVLEARVASAGWTRFDWETPAEYTERVVSAATIDAAGGSAIVELAALFREARFSEHEIGEAQRERAVDALERVDHALGSGRGARS